MQTPIQNTETFNYDDFITFTERVKKTTQITADKMENRIRNDMKIMDETLKGKFESQDKNINLMKS